MKCNQTYCNQNANERSIYESVPRLHTSVMWQITQINSEMQLTDTSSSASE